ncbi:hypothetical protein KY330_02830 [Candidatus Woesearchaeota archaeon]|nr:hypothetical protein [Candidatus Woesearchaeota archaeon]
MEYYEARSLKEIKVLLKKQGYDSKSKVRDHLSFLENLAKKINKKIIDEQSFGQPAWNQKEDLKKVHETFTALRDELKKMELQKMDSIGKPKGLF